jgi:DNA-binding CsgD family transcriptional regulator
MTRGVLEIVDAAYSSAGSDQDWIEQIASVAHSTLDEGLGVSVFTFDASSGDRVRVGLHAQRGVPPGFHGAALAETAPGEHVHALFRPSPPALLLNEALEPSALEHGYVGQALRAFGIPNVLAIRCSDPSRRGCLIAVSLPHLRPLPARRRSVLARVAAHLAAGWRLRQKLAGSAESADLAEGADAIFDAEGRLQHLDGALDARRDGDELRTSVERMRATRQAERLEPEAALELWRALVDGRWSIVQRTDTDGKRYLLARRNTPEVRDATSLAPREALAAAYAALGHSSKLIAYELGIAESSLSVLLKQAMRKLGVKNRTELALLFGT